jgi:hypothetical protein
MLRAAVFMVFPVLSSTKSELRVEGLTENVRRLPSLPFHQKLFEALAKDDARSLLPPVFHPLSSFTMKHSRAISRELPPSLPSWKRSKVVESIR